MRRAIATTLEIDGEKKFAEALRSAEREMAVMNADLRAMAAEFSATDDATRYYAQRSEMLNQKVEQQEEIVRALTQTVKESSKKYGDAAAQTDNYRIKLSNATEKLYKMRQEAEEAGRELEDLGRDSNKIGRQIENGIGDAAEDTASKLDKMFAKVSQDVETLKSSATFQATMDVGSFIVDGIQGLVGFVEENDEYNRQIAIARNNVERYGHDWDEALEMIIYAATITGNREGAYEAISNLTSSAVEDQELIRAATEALLGVFLTTGGALSFESLAEDFRASVVNRTPTGTYAETLEEILQDVVLEDVEKALKSTKSVDEAFHMALSYLTEGGFQGTTKSFEEKNQEFLETQQKQQELAIAWAELSEELAPVVTFTTDTMLWVANELTQMVKNVKENAAEWEQIRQAPEETVLNREWHRKNLEEDYPEFSEAIDSGMFDSWESTLDYVIKQLFPSAGAESLSTPETQASFEDAGSMAWTAYTSGMLAAAEENPAMQELIDQAMLSAAEETDAAFAAGQNSMISFANGVATGSVAVMNNVNSLVTAINRALASISVPAFGYGLGGITGGTIYVGGEELVSSVSRGLKVRVDTKNYLK